MFGSDPKYQSFSKKDVLLSIVNFMETKLVLPEEEIINVDDEDTDIYFVVTGFVVVNLRDHKRIVRKGARVLGMGSIFGEISMIYENKRTADVVAMDYLNLAMINQSQFKKLIIEIPPLKTQVEEHIWSYRYPKKKFFMNAAK